MTYNRNIGILLAAIGLFVWGVLGLLGLAGIAQVAIPAWLAYLWAIVTGAFLFVGR